MRGLPEQHERLPELARRLRVAAPAQFRQGDHPGQTYPAGINPFDLEKPGLGGAVPRRRSAGCERAATGPADDLTGTTRRVRANPGPPSRR